MALNFLIFIETQLLIFYIWFIYLLILKFKACYDLSIKIKNNKLKLDCLLNIIPISSMSNEYQNKIFNILKDTYSVYLFLII
jgi:hypothetical protein